MVLVKCRARLTLLYCVTLIYKEPFLHQAHAIKAGHDTAGIVVHCFPTFRNNTPCTDPWFSNNRCMLVSLMSVSFMSFLEYKRLLVYGHLSMQPEESKNLPQKVMYTRTR